MLYTLCTVDFQFGLRNVIGQPLAQKMLETSLIAQLVFKDCTPLVLYLAGGTGTGKSRTAKSLLATWLQSRLNGSSTHYFPGHDTTSNEMPVVHDEFQVSHKCPFPEGLHIFDNSDLYKPAVVRGMVKMLSSSKPIRGTKCDCSASVFIFIGNQGSNEILKIVQNAHSSGVPRNEIGEWDFGKLQSSLISKPGMHSNNYSCQSRFFQELIVISWF